MFELVAMQAEHGDALLIRYGDDDFPRYMVVDGGTADTGAAIIERLDIWRGRRDSLRLEALVVTHYDRDHIDGIIAILQNKPAWLMIEDVWFNASHHVLPSDIMGPDQGDMLSSLIAGTYSWNRAFGGRAVKISGPEPIALEGGMNVWIVSPGTAQLAELADKRRRGTVKASDSDDTAPRDKLGNKDTWPPGSFMSLATTESTPDRSIPNGSSIAMVLEYAEKKLLLTGDSFSHVVEAGLGMCWTTRQTIELCKVSHHGSQANTMPTLLRAMDCKRYLICTNGKRHGHPDNALIARLLACVTRPEIVFNYVQPRTAGWKSVLSGWPPYTVTYPYDGEAFVAIDLLRESKT